MKVVHSAFEEPKKNKPYKLSKDKRAIEAGIIKWTLENNEKVKAQKLKEQ